jgi:hypothetical protein
MNELVESKLFSASLALLDEVRVLDDYLSDIFSEIAIRPKSFPIALFPGSRVAMGPSATVECVILFRELSKNQILLERIIVFPATGIAA